jgi:3-oxoacyl-[acyl-carrier-protein] synthase II
MKRRVVITGCGLVSSVGTGQVAFWDSLIKGKNGIGPITQFDPAGFDSRIAGEVNDFVPPAFLSPKEVRRAPRFIQFALKAAEEALLDSKLDLAKLDPFRIGVVIGSGIGCMDIIEREHKVLLGKGPSRVSPFLIPMLITNQAAGWVAIQFGLKGINFCTVTACASGAHAVCEAYSLIKSGKADIMVCGGTEAAITPLGVAGFCSARALSTRNDEPSRACRPFDRDRDGFIMAEGAGILVFEELEHALKRGARIWAEFAGFGATCDAYHITAPDPTAISAAKGIELALEEAEVSPREKVYINAHGTSTELNDKIETKAIKRVFGDNAKNIYISSTKSMMGHTLGAAGAIEAIVCCMAIKNKVIPPTINYENPDPECDLNYVPNKAIEFDLKIALSNSLGFGGHNATILLKEYK